MFPNDIYIVIVVSLSILFFAGRVMDKAKRIERNAEEQIKNNQKKEREFEEYRSKSNDDINCLKRSLLVLEKEKTDGFPWLAEAYSEYKSIEDKKKEDGLRYKSHPAKKAAEVVKEIRLAKKAITKENKQNEYIIKYYETLFPRLVDYRDKNINEKFIRVTKNNNEEGNDPVKSWMTEGEYKSLSITKKNQLALDRYKTANSSKLEIGLRYERYIGFMYEQRGCSVMYHGILKGMDDLGIDLICKNGDYVELVQCKYWAQNKEIHENTINQLFGTTIKYYFDNYSDLSFENAIELLRSNVITPTLCTSCSLTDRAKEYAKILNVKVYENIRMKDYPLIKCKNSKSGGGIYHLPFDQQYDKIRMNDRSESFYVNDIEKAESLGFRRAFRWRGNIE